MSEAVYILTVIFFIYVIEVALGEEIVAFVRNVFHIDLHRPHLRYKDFRDGMIRFRAALISHLRRRASDAL